MDFKDTPEEAAFRSEVRQWLADNAQDYRKPLPAGISEEEYIARGRAWQKRKAEAGYAAICWPLSEGGLDGTSMQEMIFAEEESRFHVPVGPFVTIGTSLAVPTIRTHGKPEQIERFSRPTLEGDILWCQLFSEPGAGSDLAALRTRAVKDGDDWVVNGQKVWTSWAHVADWGIMVARTDTHVPKHKGLTYFLVDMKAQGIDVRPIPQISGESEFNEVFLTDVRIPDTHRLGEVGEGWKCAMTTLMNERGSVGGESSALPETSEVARLAAKVPGMLEAHEMALAKAMAREQGLKYFRFRMLTALSRGEAPGPIAGMSKYVYANLLQDISAMALDMHGIEGLYPDPQRQDEMARLQHGYFWGAAVRIAGGADEILLNQIAERVLGLPGEIRLDKNVPFSELPSGR